MSGCQSVLKYNPPFKYKEASSHWQITMGAYQRDGILTKNKAQNWVFLSHDEDGNNIRDHIVFDDTLNITIIRLNAKSLAYSISKWSGLEVLPSDSTYKKVTINELRYTMLTCSDWVLQAFSEEQHCMGDIAHTNHMVNNIWGEPLKIAIWLPYLKQTLILKQQ